MINKISLYEDVVLECITTPDNKKLATIRGAGSKTKTLGDWDIVLEGFGNSLFGEKQADFFIKTNSESYSLIFRYYQLIEPAPAINVEKFYHTITYRNTAALVLEAKIQEDVTKNSYNLTIKWTTEGGDSQGNIILRTDYFTGLTSALDAKTYAVGMLKGYYESIHQSLQKLLDNI